MVRQLFRPSLDRDRWRGAGKGPRRTQPPEATNAEASYLRQALQSGRTLVVAVVGGSEIRGRVEFYDRDCIGLVPDGTEGPLVLRKDKIKYYWAEMPDGSGARETGKRTSKHA